MSENLTNLKTIEKLLGPIRKDQLNNTDNFISDKVAMFMPVSGFCNYAVTAMHSNLHKKITVEDLAKIANMSPSYYVRTFKKETGQSSIGYLNQIRLERVKRLLLEGDKAITEIALECGFSSSAYLSSSFYNKFKISPTDYRNLLKKGDISKD
ncbi:AraC family transcriptional regulator [Clostridium sp. OS1-26]|uniref:helix-turn-helix transcriptional regulator n=1 Tax=Clostridium sp. OS1-26 TaxID=3070681 RepID=UPI0027DFAE36|nr:AraC family transcriptional regulator [Clostridium sp. OS1-26]WML34372.1 AraC family transcriptional regulator [Clostridium sp. OS1-26]